MVILEFVNLCKMNSPEPSERPTFTSVIAFHTLLPTIFVSFSWKLRPQFPTPLVYRDKKYISAYDLGADNTLHEGEIILVEY